MAGVGAGAFRKEGKAASLETTRALLLSETVLVVEMLWWRYSLERLKQFSLIVNYNSKGGGVLSSGLLSAVGLGISTGV
jgi:hypothetical protein